MNTPRISKIKPQDARVTHLSHSYFPSLKGKVTLPYIDDVPPVTVCNFTPACSKMVPTETSDLTSVAVDPVSTRAEYDRFPTRTGTWHKLATAVQPTVTTGLVCNGVSASPLPAGEIRFLSGAWTPRTLPHSPPGHPQHCSGRVGGSAGNSPNTQEGGAWLHSMAAPPMLVSGPELWSQQR